MGAWQWFRVKLRTIGSKLFLARWRYLCYTLVPGVKCKSVPKRGTPPAPAQTYLCFGDEVLGQLDDGEVAAADGPAHLVESHAQQLVRLIRLLLSQRRRRTRH